MPIFSFAKRAVGPVGVYFRAPDVPRSFAGYHATRKGVVELASKNVLIS